MMKRFTDERVCRPFCQLRLHVRRIYVRLEACGVLSAGEEVTILGEGGKSAV